MDYALTDGVYTLPMSYSLPKGYDTLNLWVYGDASGNTLSFASDKGSVSTALDFAGWKQISLTLLVSLFLTQFSQICTKTKIIYVKPMKS